MPPLYAQDPLGAANAALQSRALELPMAALLVACEPWMLVLVALALYSWLEGEVRGVLKAVAPAAISILLAVGVALAARAAGAAPRPLEASGFAPLLRAAFPAPHAAGVAAFATFSLLVYGRRALTVLALAALCAMARVRMGSHWAADLAAGGMLGVLAAGVTYVAALRLLPRGHLSALRARRLPRAPRQRGAANPGGEAAERDAEPGAGSS
ncbi:MULTISPECIES: phosphatase PAP2 family protein [Anaeromyxobacter]|uniref:phosphatase PAP2 family protein n=1 Tax=Anaeromyxobacter TaxID=161492 RepID=UPI001F5AC548|nr:MULTISPECIES: phosphatase PAP2 family protein [unclassified Anaeromyxobacter]